VIKQPGLCTLCATECFEIVTRYDSGFPHLEGRVRQVANPLDLAWRVALVLFDGSHADLTFCEDCLPEVENRIPEIYRTMIESCQDEISDGFRGNVGLNLFSEEEKAVHLQMLLDRPPLGILYKVKWSEVYHGH